MDTDRGLFLVADGMGGYGHGDVASRLAVASVGRWIAESSIEACPHCRRRHSHRELLRDAVERDGEDDVTVVVVHVNEGGC